MATSFLNFAHLPDELRRMIWNNALPSDDSKTMPLFLQSLEHLILSQPQDRDFGRAAVGKYDKLRIVLFKREHASPYAALEACAESRTVAVRHLKRALVHQKALDSWLKNHKYPFKPELIVSGNEGKMTYRCAGITDALDLNEFIFWDFREDKQAQSSTPVGLVAVNDLEFLQTPSTRGTQEQVVRSQIDYYEAEDDTWENDAFATDFSDEEALPWDDDSDSEDSGIMSLTPVLKIPAFVQDQENQDVRSSEAPHVLETQNPEEALRTARLLADKWKRDQDDVDDNHFQPSFKRQK